MIWVIALPAMLTIGFPGLSTGASPAALAIAVDGISPSAISVHWTQSSDLTFSHYLLESSPGGEAGPWSTVATIGTATATTYFASGLTAGTTNGWRVTVYDTVTGAGATATTQAAQPSAAWLSVSLSSNGSANLSWTNNASYGGHLKFVGYAIGVGDGSGGVRNLTTLTSVASRQFHATGLPFNSSVRFQLLTSDGCSGAANCGPSTSPSVTGSNVATLAVPPALVVAVSASPSNLSAGGSTTLSCVATGGVPPYSFTWKFDDRTSAPMATVTHTYRAAGNFLPRCFVTDAVGSVSIQSTPVSVNATAPSGGSGGGNSPPGGGGTSKGGPGGGGVALSAPSIGPTAAVVLILAFIGAVVWLAALVSRRRPTDPPVPPGARGEATPIADDRTEPLAPSPPPLRGRSPRTDFLDLDARMDALEGAADRSR